MSALTLPVPPAATTPDPSVEGEARHPGHSRPQRSGRTLAMVIIGVVFLLLTSACARRAPIPTSYGGTDSGVEKNFVTGCDGTKGKQPGDQPVSKKTCECYWSEIKKK